MPCNLWDPNSLTRDRTHNIDSKSKESQPLNLQGIPLAVLIYRLCSGLQESTFSLTISFFFFLEVGKRRKNWTGCTRVLVGWWTVMSTCWGVLLTNMFLKRWRRRRQAVLRRQDSSQALSLPRQVPIPFWTWPAKSEKTRFSSSGTDEGLGRGFCRDAQPRCYLASCFMVGKRLVNVPDQTRFIHLPLVIK